MLLVDEHLQSVAQQRTTHPSIIKSKDIHARVEGHRQPAAHRLPDEGEPADERAADARALAGDGPLRKDSGAPQRRAEVRAARRPAVRQRQHPHGHGDEQDPEGARRQVAIDGGLRRAVRRRLRLPRAADRAAGRSRARSEEASDVGRRFLPRVPRVRGALRRHDERAVPAPRHPRHLGRAVPDDELQVPGGDRARVRPLRRAGSRLQRQEAGALVHPLPHGARGSRSRVRGSHVAVDLRGVSARSVERGRARGARAGARRERRLGSNLDDDAVDDSVEPRDRVSSGLRLRRVRRRGTRGHRRRGAGGKSGGGGREIVRRADRAHERRAARTHPLSASVVRAPVARRAGRVRHARGGNGRRPHRARPRRRRLRDRHEVRAGDLRADRTDGTFPRHGGTVRRPARVRREPERRRCAEGTRTAVASRVVLAPVSALLALSQSGHLPRDVAVVHRTGQTAGGWGLGAGAWDAAAGRAREHRSPRAMDPVVGPRPHVQHDRQPSRLVHLAAARVGRADSGGGLHVVRRGGRHAGARRENGRRVREARRRLVVRASDGGFRSRRSRVSQVRRPPFRARDEHSRRLVRLGVEP